MFQFNLNLNLLQRRRRRSTTRSGSRASPSYSQWSVSFLPQYCSTVQYSIVQYSILLAVVSHHFVLCLPLTGKVFLTYSFKSIVTCQKRIFYLPPCAGYCSSGHGLQRLEQRETIQRSSGQLPLSLSRQLSLSLSGRLNLFLWVNCYWQLFTFPGQLSYSS